MVRWRPVYTVKPSLLWAIDSRILRACRHLATVFASIIRKCQYEIRMKCRVKYKGGVGGPARLKSFLSDQKLDQALYIRVSYTRARKRARSAASSNAQFGQRSST